MKKIMFGIVILICATLLGSFIWDIQADVINPPTEVKYADDADKWDGHESAPLYNEVLLHDLRLSILEGMTWGDIFSSSNNVYTGTQTYSNSITVYKNGGGGGGSGIRHFETGGTNGVETWVTPGEQWIYGTSGDLPLLVGAGGGWGAMSVWSNGDNIAVVISTNVSDISTRPIVYPLEIHGNLAVTNGNIYLNGTNVVDLHLLKAGDTANANATFNWNAGTFTGLSNMNSSAGIKVTNVPNTAIHGFSIWNNAGTEVFFAKGDGTGLGAPGGLAGSGYSINSYGVFCSGSSSGIWNDNPPLYLTGNGGTVYAGRNQALSVYGTNVELWASAVAILRASTNALTVTNAPIVISPYVGGVTNNHPLIVSNSTYALCGIGGAAGDTCTITLSAPRYAGQQLDIAVCSLSTCKVAIADSGTVDLSATWTGWTNDTLSLWAYTNTIWVERTRCVRP